MGGMGSGRRGGRDCTDQYRSVDVRRLRREGALRAGTAFNYSWTRPGGEVSSISARATDDCVQFHYSIRERGGPWVEVSCDARLDFTPMHFGGRQTWWRCPCCDRRVALLYVGRSMACRHCWNLAYRSEREGQADRARRRAEKIRARLGWRLGIGYPCGDKPRGMHWRTFERLRAEHDLHAARWVAAVECWIRAHYGPRDLG